MYRLHQLTHTIRYACPSIVNNWALRPTRYPPSPKKTHVSKGKHATPKKERKKKHAVKHTIYILFFLPRNWRGKSFFPQNGVRWTTIKGKPFFSLLLLKSLPPPNRAWHLAGHTLRYHTWWWIQPTSRLISQVGCFRLRAFFALLLQEKKNTKGSNHNLIGGGISQRHQDLLEQESTHTHTHSSHILENTPTRVCFYHPSGKRVSRKLFSTKSWRFVLCFFSMKKLFSTVCWKKDSPFLTYCIFTKFTI